MPIKFVRGDITKIKCDAIVNAANSFLLGGGGVDGAIHRAAGIQLLNECRTLGGCETGNAKITKGYNLPAKYVIHTVGPIYNDGKHNEKQLLESCYNNSLKLAIKHNCESIAFPLISSGVYGYPKEEALSVAIDSINKFLQNYDLLVYVVIFNDVLSYISNSLHNKIESFISTNLENEYEISQSVTFESTNLTDDIESKLNNLDESFSQMVLRKIDEKGLTDVECYKKANIDRKLFSKIRSNVEYKPSKKTAIALGIALELSKTEMDDLLNKAGFSLSNSYKFDVIVKYFIENEMYNINEINEMLFAFDQQLLEC